MTDGMDFWVFAYGSLIWNPGFDPAERILARLDGFRRSFCMASVVYRGTPEAPGLVLALDRAPDTVCQGVAYRVGAEHAPKTLQYLRDRELVSSAYLEKTETLTLADGRQIRAICYVMDKSHDQYRGNLSLDERAHVIATAHGPAGSNRDYLNRTAQSLKQLDIVDADMAWLEARVAQLGEFGA